jgi:peptide/nickel transport system permease protein
MGRYLIRRLLIMIPMLIGITFMVFGLVNFLPGSPYSNLRGNPKIRPADIERLEAQLGLNDPWPQRYGEWLWALLQGDLGRSIHNRIPVTTRILDALPNTLLLTASSLVVTLAIAVPIGVYAALNHKRAFDRIVSAISVALYAIPGAWLSILMVVLFAFKFKEWGLPSLPATGLKDPRNGGHFLDRLEHMILPVVSLSLVNIGWWSTVIRSSMLEALHSDFVRTAHAKGLKRRRVLFAHAFRVAGMSLVTLVGFSIGGLFGGSILVETVFAWPGMGLLTLDAITKRDYTMIMGTTVMYTFIVMMTFLLVDIMYAVVDPRIRVK